VPEPDRARIVERRARFAGFGTRELRVDGDGPCVVFAHGYGDSADTWRGVLAELGRRGRAGVAVDLPGFGQADPRRRGPQLPQLDAFFADVLALRGGPGAVAVGNSLGGAVAVRAAQRSQPALVAVMAIGVAGMGYSRLARLTVRGPGRAVNAATRIPIPPRLVAVLATRALPLLIYGDRHAVDPEVIRRMCAQVPDYRAVRAVLRAGGEFVRETRGCFELDRVRCPTLIVHGARDRLIPVAAARLMHAQIPHSRLLILPRAGHCPQLDVPATIAQLALELAPKEQGCQHGHP
jgi:pimeloyl-ACP methyl ester carboxylesterase